VFGFGPSTSEELITAADSFVDIGEHEDQFLL
jgi:uncharacterized LabA/DUF88 family protein